MNPTIHTHRALPQDDRRGSSRGHVLARFRVAGWAGVLVVGCRCPMPGAEIPAEVRYALQQNAARLVPITVEWRMTRTSPLPLPELLARMKQPGATSFLYGKQIEVAIQSGRVCYKEQVLRGDGRIERNFEKAFDRECIYQRLGDAKHANVHVTLLELRKFKQGNEFYTPYFECAGFFVPNTPEMFGQLKLPESTALRALETGSLKEVRPSTLDSLPTLRLVVSMDQREEVFWVAPSFAYAVVRHDSYKDGQLFRRRTAREHREVGPGVWLPMHTQVESFLEHGLRLENETPVVIESHRVTTLDTATIDDSKFVLPIEPGTVVADSRPPEARDRPGEHVIFVQPARPEEIPAAIAKGIAEQDAARRKSEWLYILMGLR